MQNMWIALCVRVQYIKLHLSVAITALNFQIMAQKYARKYVPLFPVLLHIIHHLRLTIILFRLVCRWHSCERRGGYTE